MVRREHRIEAVRDLSDELVVTGGFRVMCRIACHESYQHRLAACLETVPEEVESSSLCCVILWSEARLIFSVVQQAEHVAIGFPERFLVYENDLALCEQRSVGAVAQ